MAISKRDKAGIEGLILTTQFSALLILKLRFVLAAIFLLPFALQCFAQEAELQRIGSAPPFSLTTQDNRPLAWADLRGKPIVLTFIFTRCRSACPVLTAKLVDIQRRFSLEQKGLPQFVAVSIEPAHDTPDVLKAYANNFGADLRAWSFLTGSPAAIAELARRYAVYVKRQADESIDHTFLTSLIDSDGIIRVQYQGTQFDRDEFLSDLRLLVRSGKSTEVSQSETARERSHVQ